MYGHIFRVLGVIMVITILNFYRNVIRRDREMQANALKKKLDADAVRAAIASVTTTSSELEEIDKKITSIDGIDDKYCFDQWLEYDGKCNAIHIFLIRPDKETVAIDEQLALSSDLNGITAKSRHRKNISNYGSSANDKSETNYIMCAGENNNNNIVNEKANMNSEREIIKTEKESSTIGSAGHTVSRATVIEAQQTAKIMDKSKLGGTAKEITSIIVYVSIVLLIVSLIKAALDMTKYLHEKRQGNKGKIDDLVSRYSLHDYSQLKRQNDNKRKSVSRPPALVPQTSVDSGCNNPSIKEQVRRMSNNLQDYQNGSGIPTEPGSPAKPGKLLAGRPAPLLRRCSVPVFAKKCATGTLSIVPRRPSMDSLSEDDSSPDVKRRVRMIHRH